MKTPLVIVRSYTLSSDYGATLGITRETLALRLCVSIARAWRASEENPDALAVHADSSLQCVDVKDSEGETVYTVSWERAEFLKP